MNKKDFLEILKDYLKGTFSEMEINDILRDYEEFFLNGELEGKSDEEIIKNLGSPKAIAKELIEEIKGGTSENKNGDEVKEKINREAKKAWKNVKYASQKAGKKGKEFLDSSTIVNGDISGAAVKGIIFVITCLLIIPSFTVIMTMIVSGLGLIGFTVGNIAAYIGTFIFFGIGNSIGFFGLFISIGWTGLVILLWLLYCLVWKALKHLVVVYISWIKKRNMYVRVKEKHEGNSGKEAEKEDSSEKTNVEEFKALSVESTVDLNNEENKENNGGEFNE